MGEGVQAPGGWGKRARGGIRSPRGVNFNVNFKIGRFISILWFIDRHDIHEMDEFEEPQNKKSNIILSWLQK